MGNSAERSKVPETVLEKKMIVMEKMGGQISCCTSFTTQSPYAWYIRPAT